MARGVTAVEMGLGVSLLLGPSLGRVGRTRNRRRRAVEVTVGPRSRGVVGVREGGVRAVTLVASSVAAGRVSSSPASASW